MSISHCALHYFVGRLILELVVDISVLEAVNVVQLSDRVRVSRTWPRRASSRWRTTAALFQTWLENSLKCFVIFQSVLAPILNSKSSLSFHLFAAKLSALNQFKVSRSAIPCCSPFRIKAILCHVLFSLIAAAEPYLDSTCSKFLLSFSLPMLQKRRPLPTRQQLAALVGVVATASSTCRGTVDARS